MNYILILRQEKLRGFGRPLIGSTLTVAISTGQSGEDLTKNAVANLGWDEIRMTNLVFLDDTFWSESLVLDKRESVSRPYTGIVLVKTRALNQHGLDVCSFKGTFLVDEVDSPGSRSVRPEPVSPNWLG